MEAASRVGNARSEAGGVPDMPEVETDLIVFGSGAGGLSASLFAAKRGLEVVLCEKSPRIGGTTALSAGMVWIPGSRQAVAAGIQDTLDNAREYLRNELGEFYQPDLADAYLASGPEALAELERDTEVKFALASAPDYHSSQKGGVDKGRALNTRPFDARLLGDDFGLVRYPLPRMLVLGGMMISSSEVPAFLNPFGSFSKFRHVARRLLRYGADRIRYRRGTELGNGNALVARFLYSLKKTPTAIWTNTPLVELLTKDGRVTGAIVSRDGVWTRVRARRGVVLATGGFAHDPSLTARLCRGFWHTHSLVHDGNTGDGIRSAVEAGAAIDRNLASPGLWTPASELREIDGTIRTIPYGWLDRGRPGLIAVNPDGQRFVNESNSYHDIIAAMFRDKGGTDARFYFICDRRFLRKRGLGMLLPWPWTRSLRAAIEKNYITMADSLAELAEKIGVDAQNLLETVRRHNEYAAAGTDPDFGRGASAFNRTLGDPAVKPNPNLGPLTKAPFAALRIVPATLGTAVGLNGDGDARVLDESGQPIPGLYACGNDLVSPMRGFYPGAGIAIGPAIVFGYRAALHAAAD